MLTPVVLDKWRTSAAATGERHEVLGCTFVWNDHHRRCLVKESSLLAHLREGSQARGTIGGSASPRIAGGSTGICTRRSDEPCDQNLLASGRMKDAYFYDEGVVVCAIRAFRPLGAVDISGRAKERRRRVQGKYGGTKCSIQG